MVYSFKLYLVFVQHSMSRILEISFIINLPEYSTTKFNDHYTFANKLKRTKAFLGLNMITNIRVPIQEIVKEAVS